MKDRETIKNTIGVKIKKEGEDGFAGTVYKVSYKKRETIYRYKI